MKRTTLYISAALALALALAGCTKEDTADGVRLPAGEYPVVIQATGLSVEAMPQTAASRATVDGDWDGVTSVALLIGGEVKVYDVTADAADNTRATLSRENDPFWWTSREDITASAWWPYDADDIAQMPAVVVREDQSEWANFAASDYIAAIDHTVQFDKQELAFTHRTARVAVKLTAGDGFSDSDIGEATVRLTGLSRDNGNPDAVKAWFDKGGNSHEALTAPQTVAADKPFIEVNIGGGSFYFLPREDIVLEAGTRHIYTIRVSASGLTLEGSTIGDWADGGGESGAAEDLGFTYNANTHTCSVYTPNGLTEWAKAAQSDLSLNCTLTEDINMAGKDWTPIGNSLTSGTGYQGTFDGQGHCITGLAITTDNPSGEGAALFGGIGGNGEVKNLQLKDVNCDVRQNGVAGGIAMSNYGTITACSVTGDISSTGGYVGGIATSNIGSIIGCWFDGNLTSGLGNGGIAALNYSTITACFYGGNAGQGATNQGGTAEVTKVDGVTVKWQTAVDGMNPALTGNGYQWALGTDGLPVLQKKQ